MRKAQPRQFTKNHIKTITIPWTQLVLIINRAICLDPPFFRKKNTTFIHQDINLKVSYHGRCFMESWSLLQQRVDWMILTFSHFLFSLALFFPLAAHTEWNSPAFYSSPWWSKLLFEEEPRTQITKHAVSKLWRRIWSTWNFANKALSRPRLQL